jgi:hypothetical protein
MKLPLQIAAVVREGRSWPAGCSSAHGVSASFRTDLDVCVSGATPDKWKCNYNPGYNYQVCKCPNGTCNCCQYGCEPAQDRLGIPTGGCACKPKP